MNKAKPTEGTIAEASAAPASRRPVTSNRRETILSPALQQLADTLRDQGHAVHTASMHPAGTDDQELASSAAYFFDRVLTLPSATTPRRAYVRLYHSNTLLFLEVTQLRPNSYESVTRQRSVRETLHELNEWSRCHDHPLSIRRGPRDQLRVALLVPCPPANRQHYGEPI